MEYMTYGIALRNSSKKVEEWTSSDYHTMIKFKQLNKDNMPPLRTTLPRRLHWYQVARFMEDPIAPAKPDGYVDIEQNPTAPQRPEVDSRGCSDDDMSEASIPMFPV